MSAARSQWPGGCDAAPSSRTENTSILAGDILPAAETPGVSAACLYWLLGSLGVLTVVVFVTFFWRFM
jgi:hypothetical protein